MIKLLRNIKQLCKQAKMFLLEFGASRIKVIGANRSVGVTRLLVYSHALEKGMSMKHIKQGYGIEKARAIISDLMDYKMSGLDRKAFCYIESLSVLKSYIRFQTERGVNVSEIEAGYEQLIDSEEKEIVDLSNRYSAGIKSYGVDDLKPHGGNFEGLLNTRHTVRSFIDKSVAIEDIEKAIQLANHAPSACNRQPSRVYYAQSENKKKRINELITGNAGFENELHDFLVVTCDRALFQSVEGFQWYVNGGIYLGYLSMALHACNLGACIMQWFPFYKTEAALKSILGVNKTEAIVAIVAIGYYCDISVCLCAQRKTAYETLYIV